MPVKKALVLLILILIFSSCFIFAKSSKVGTDVLVVGGGTAGIAAGIQSARMGTNTLIVEQTTWLGGMLTAAGVSAADGNNLLPSGIWEEFRQELYKYYDTDSLATGWVSATCFEPRVGDSILKMMVARERTITVLYNWFFQKAIKEGSKVTGVLFVNRFNDSLLVNAKMIIDATELGDVFADAGAEYDLGMEDKTYSKESMAPGKNQIIQDITWVAILKDYGKDSAITFRPDNYDPTQYYCSCTSAPCKNGKPYDADAKKMLEYGKLPDSLYMINWPAHGNDYYLNVVEMKPMDRLQEYQKAKDLTLGFVYFIQTELGFHNLGLMDQYFPTPDRLPLMPYNREGRRVKGLTRLNVNQIMKPYDQNEHSYRTGISVGDYPVDHHHNANKIAPKINFPEINSFSIPLGSLIPEKIEGLIVAEKGISVSNIVNGATRLQPCVMLTGQAAGALAAYSVKKKIQPRQSSIREVQEILLESNCMLMPFVDVTPFDRNFIPIQRVALTGIIKGRPKPSKWENKTFFYPDSLIKYDVWEKGMREFDPTFPVKRIPDQSFLTIKETFNVLIQYLNSSKDSLLIKKANIFIEELGKTEKISRRWESFYYLKNYNPNRQITRRELAVLIYYLRLTSGKDKMVDWSGNFIVPQSKTP